MSAERLITVCVECKRACCWHPSYYSAERIREVCGGAE